MAKNVVIFNGTNASGRDGIWITDGTAAGTQELTGITGAYSGGGGLQFDPLDFTVFNGKVLFLGFNTTATGGLWVTDGTASGTYELTGIAGANLVPEYGLDPSDLTVFGGSVLFNGTNAASQHGLWVTDGTAPGTHELQGINGAFTGAGGLDPSNLTAFGNKALFSGTDDRFHKELWVTDGTVAGTHELTIATGNLGGLQPADFTVFNGQVLFEGFDYDPSTPHRGLWVTDGTQAGTHEVTGIGGAYSLGLFYGGFTPDFTVFNGEVLFRGQDAAGYPGLWITNGTAAGTYELTGINPPYLSPANLTVFGQQVLFSATNAAGHVGLWVTDGTAAGTHELTGIGGVASSGLNPGNLTVFDGEVIFTGRNAAGALGLWATDGTAGGTHELTGIAGANLGTYSFLPLALTSVMRTPEDFNRDGISDILWYNSGSGDVGDWLTINDQPAWQFISGSSAPWQVVGVGDFNGDGTSDVLWRSSTTGEVLYWQMNNNQAQQQLLGFSSTTMNFAGIGDFNADGISDVLWINPANNLVGTWLFNNGQPAWALVDQGSTTMSVAGIGDFNGDGTSDVLWQNPTNNLVGYWAMNGAVDTWHLIDQGSTTMNIVGIGDFNGDGTADILWRNNANGLVGMWAMNNGVDTWSLIDQSSADFQVAGIGDYNGDGTSDILWRNPTTGDVGIWTMNNGVDTWHYLGVSSMAYHPVT